jgi:hypothetical protein
MFDGRRVDMVNLLLGETEGRSAGDGSILLISEALDLAHALAATVRATLVVGVDLGVVHAVEAFGHVLANLGHLSESLVREHVCCVPIDGSVAGKNNIVVAVFEGVISGRGSSTDSAVLETSSCVAGERETT